MEKKLHGFDFRDADNKVLHSFEFEIEQKSHTFTLTGGDATSCSIYSNGYSYGNSQNVTTVINEIMVNLGDVKEYEPYGASPKPEFPSKIRNVGDNVNLFNKDTTTDGKYIDDAGILKSQETATISDYIEIKTNKDLYVSGKKSTWVSYALYDKDKTFLSRPMTKTPNGILKVTNTNCKYIRMNLSLEDKDTLKIQQGTQATTYTPFRLWKCRY